LSADVSRRIDTITIIPASILCSFEILHSTQHFNSR